LIIITAAVLLELLSAAQYYFTRRLMATELEKRAESELTLKAILIKSNLNDAEEILNHYMWKIQAHLHVPDSAYTTMRHIVEFSTNIKGAGIGFVPDYYPEKGKWFEPYARRNNSGEVEIEQIGGPEHDYTQKNYFADALKATDGLWVEPFYDREGAQELITSFLRPVYDRSGNAVAVTGVDIPLKWLSDTIDKRHIYPSSFLMVLNEDGKPVIYPWKDRVKPEMIRYLNTLICDSTVERQKSISGRSTLIRFDTDRRDGTIIYAYMKGEPHWRIAVVCYDDEVYASLSQLRVLMLLLSLAAFTILLFVVWRFASSVRKLEQKTQEQQRMDGELQVASGIQQALLPVDEPTLAGVSDVQVEGRLIPAKAVGGDLYNVFVRDEKLFFCVGDVSGKGVPAALIMAITQVLFRDIASRESNPMHIMNRINQMACRNNRNNIFITMFVGVLDLPTGILRYCNAGHNKPIMVNCINSQEIDAKPNLPVGLFDDFKYDMQEMTIESGSTLFLYTDGLTEAKDIRRKQFGEERLMRLIADSHSTDTRLLVDTAVTQVTQFAEGTEQSDDLTLLAIRYAPKQEETVLSESLTLKNDPRQVSLLSSFVKDVFGRLDIEPKLARDIRLAVEEAVVNVIDYAYPRGMEGDVAVDVSSNGHQVKVIISDTGTPFDPTKENRADTTLSVEDRPIGGLGILLVRKLMDSINYERINGKNVLTLKKKYNGNKD
jgi:sigma-B regulation protein RsbU (phosphoserine phosphatase)